VAATRPYGLAVTVLIWKANDAGFRDATHSGVARIVARSSQLDKNAEQRRLLIESNCADWRIPTCCRSYADWPSIPFPAIAQIARVHFAGVDYAGLDSIAR